MLATTIKKSVDKQQVHLKSAVSQFFNWDDPRNLWTSVQQIERKISSEDLMNRAGEHYQKLKEAIVAATFAIGFARHVSSVQIRMTSEELLDFELRDKLTGEYFQFEIVMAIEPNRQPGLEYRDGKRPSTPMSAFSGVPIDAVWIAPCIRNKTEKAMRKKVIGRHLLVYQNISGGSPDLKKLSKLCSEAAVLWESVWIISGIPDWGGIALLFNKHGFSWRTERWLSYVNAQEGRGSGGFDLYLQ